MGLLEVELTECEGRSNTRQINWTKSLPKQPDILAFNEYFPFLWCKFSDNLHDSVQSHISANMSFIHCFFGCLGVSRNLRFFILFDCFGGVFEPRENVCGTFLQKCLNLLKGAGLFIFKSQLFMNILPRWKHQWISLNI